MLGYIPIDCDTSGVDACAMGERIQTAARRGPKVNAVYARQGPTVAHSLLCVSVHCRSGSTIMHLRWNIARAPPLPSESQQIQRCQRWRLCTEVIF